MTEEDSPKMLREKLNKMLPCGYRKMVDDRESPVPGEQTSDHSDSEAQHIHSPTATRSDLWSIILLAHTSMWLYADQNLMAPNLTAIADSFGMTDEEKDTMLGGEVSFAFFIVGGVVALTIGPLSDSVNRINLFTWVVWLGALPCLLTLAVKTYWQFLLLRTLTGISLGGALPIIFSLAGDFSPPTQRNRIAGLITVLLSVGQALGQVIAGDVGAELGWRAPFALVAAPALASAALVQLTVREPPRGRFAHHGENLDMHSAKLSWKKFHATFKIPTNCLIFIQGIFGCVPWSVISTYLSDYLHEDKGLSIQVATSLFAVFSVGCGIGVVFGGVAGQYFYNKKKGSEMAFAAATTIIGMVPFLVFVNRDFPGGRPAFFDYALSFAGGLAGATGPNIRAAIMNVNPALNQGTMFALYTVADDLGRGLGPALVALLVAATSRARAFNIGFCCWIPCALLVSLMVCTIPSDEAKLEEAHKQDIVGASCQHNGSSSSKATETNQSFSSLDNVEKQGERALSQVVANDDEQRQEKEAGRKKDSSIGNTPAGLTATAQTKKTSSNHSPDSDCHKKSSNYQLQELHRDLKNANNEESKHSSLTAALV